MLQQKFNKARFNAALARQWQQCSLNAAQQMTPHQAWQAIGAARAARLAAQPRDVTELRAQESKVAMGARRWLKQCNPLLAGLTDETLKTEWVSNPDALTGLEAYADHQAFRQRYRSIKQQNKPRDGLLKSLEKGKFSDGDKHAFDRMLESLTKHDDPWRVLADSQASIEVQQRGEALQRAPQGWTRVAIFNTARTGMFSSDRSIRDYQQRIWQAPR